MKDDRDDERPAPPYEYAEGKKAFDNFDRLFGEVVSVAPKEAPAPAKAGRGKRVNRKG